MRLSLANVVPTIVLDGDVTRVRVDNVADIAQPKPYNVIHGQHTFRVAGHKLILSDEGASAYLGSRARTARASPTARSTAAGRRCTSRGTTSRR